MFFSPAAAATGGTEIQNNGLARVQWRRRRRRPTGCAAFRAKVLPPPTKGEPSMAIKHLDSGEILSQAVEHNGVVYVCGLTADDLSADARGQTEQVLRKIDDRLAKCGTDKSKLLAATIYLTDINQKPAMNEAWKAWLGPLKRPTRACVGAALGTPDTLVEIVVSAEK
jgi:enamine deaminase RidA (YjgF/YER057c/UK114 family)